MGRLVFPPAAVPPIVAQDLASSSCFTLDRRYLFQANNGLTSGRIEAGAAECVAAGTFTKIAFMTGTTGPSAVTACRLGVWDSATGAKLGETADFGSTDPQGSAWAASTRYLASLASSVSLAQGAKVWIGMVFLGTTMNLRGVTAVTTAMSGDTPAISRVQSGYATGALPALTSTGSGSLLHWFELRP